MLLKKLTIRDFSEGGKTIKETCKKLVTLTITATFIGILGSVTALSAGETRYPWPSWRHDLLNTAAAPDSGYPTDNTVLWKVDRSDRPDLPGTPAAAGGPVVVDKGMVFTTGRGIVEAVDQFTGETLIWSRSFPHKNTTSEPEGIPYDWCYNDVPTLESNTGWCYVEDPADCPSWCFECTTDKPDCSKFSLIQPLAFPEGYAQFISGPTLDTPNSKIIFGTFDGRVICLNMDTGETIWERTPFKDPGGPNENAPWFDQKFAWHLSPPSIHDGNVYIGSFLPGFYWIFRSFPYVFSTDEETYHPARVNKAGPAMFSTVGAGAHWGNHFGTFWVGHDGWFYALDEDDGSILWDWDPQGCGITNIPPVDNDGNVYINDDFHTTNCFGLFRSFKSNGEHNWTFGPTPVAQGGSQSISGDTIFFPGSDGVLWAMNKNTGAQRWTYHGGFSIKGASGLTAGIAIDETHGWVLGSSDNGHIFVVNKKTGALVREAYIGVPEWNPGDDIPSSGFWFSGSGSMVIVPSQTLLYIAATDYERAWQGQFINGKEKLFCYDYGSGKELKLVWEYQFCSDDDQCADLDSQNILRGWDQQTTSFYNVPSPSLSDGHVYYNSYNGKVYCFGGPFDSTGNKPEPVDCPARVATGNDKSKLDVLRKFRDLKMDNTDMGKNLIALYYEHAEEISGMLLADEGLKKMTAEVISRIVEKPGSYNKEFSVDNKTVADILNIADLIKTNASPALKQAIEDIKEAVDSDIIFNKLWP